MGAAQHHADQGLSLVGGHLLPGGVGAVLEGAGQPVVIPAMQQLVPGLVGLHLLADDLLLLPCTLAQIHLVAEGPAHGGDPPGLQGGDP